MQHSCGWGYNHTDVHRINACHSRYDTNHVFGASIDSNNTIAHVRVALDLQDDVVDSGQVSRARGLNGILRALGERVDIDELVRDLGVVLQGLDLTIVVGLTQGHTIVTVELQLGGDHGIDGDGGGGNTSDSGVSGGGILNLDRVIEPVIEVDGRLLLEDPDQLLNRVVEVELHVHDVLTLGLGFSTSELQLVDEVSVVLLGEQSALPSIQEDVVAEQEAVSQVTTLKVNIVVGTLRGVDDNQTGLVAQLHIEANLVVLEGNQGQSLSPGSVEPEFQRNVQHLVVGGVVQQSIDVASSSDQATQLLTDGARELLPDVQEVTVVNIELVTTDQHGQATDSGETQTVSVRDTSGRGSIGVDDGTTRITRLDGWRGSSHVAVKGTDVSKVHDNVGLSQQVTVTLDGGLELLTQGNTSVEGYLDLTNSEVGVSLIRGLEVSHRGTNCQVCILSALGGQISQNTSGSGHFKLVDM
jgi:hypothetical protein